MNQRNYLHLQDINNNTKNLLLLSESISNFFPPLNQKMIKIFCQMSLTYHVSIFFSFTGYIRL